jgi:hypothetical protein
VEQSSPFASTRILRNGGKDMHLCGIARRSSGFERLSGRVHRWRSVLPPPLSALRGGRT